MTQFRSFKALLTPEAAALVFTAVTGLAVAVSAQQSPHGMHPIVDERAYLDWARRIAGGQLQFPEPFYLDPLPAYLLGLLLKLGGGSVFFPRVVYVALGVGTVALVGKLARTLFSPREGRVAMWLLALYGPHAFALGWVLKEALAVHLTAWVLLLAAQVQAPGVSPRRWGWLGLAAGALMLSRGNVVPLMPFLGGWVLVRAWTSKEAVGLRRAQVLAFGLGVAIALAPVSLHNARAGGSPLPVTVQGGANFWIGNNPEASGTYDHWPFSFAIPSHEKNDYRAEAERRVGHPLTLRENSNYWFGLGLQFWKEQPGDALALLAKKCWLLIHNYEIPDTYAFSCFRAHFTPVLWGLPLGFGWLIGLAVAGMWLAARTSRRSWFAIAFFALYGAAVAAFFVFDRYRLPMCLALCVFAAHALVEIQARIAARRTQGLWVGAVLVAGLTVLAFVPTPISREQDNRDAYCVAQAGMVLYADGKKEQAAPLLEFGRAHGQQEWIDEKLALLGGK